MAIISRSRVVLLVAVALACGACQAEGPRARPEKRGGDQPAKKPPILIYSDMSPGSYLHALGWKMVGEGSDRGAVLTTDPAEFTTRLAGGRHEHIVVAERYTGSEPAYAAVLRNYLAAHPRAYADLYIWHDNGTQPPADSIVRATTAFYLWSDSLCGGLTTVCYSNAVYDPSATSDGHKPYTVRGRYLWPDFATIGIKDPEIITQQAKMCVSTQVDDDCYARCLKRYRDKLQNCESELNEMRDYCYALHGPGEQGMGDPDALAECISFANDSNKMCMKTAAFLLNNCIELCDRAEQGVQSPGE
ncbi:MAG: hypothetical protein KAY37_07530 [Phycisphaerae bacterium]|nr:hypothetical protein [Phycisphaerae bacterium]